MSGGKGCKLGIEEKIKRIRMEEQFKKINLRESLEKECCPVLVRTFRGPYNDVFKHKDGGMGFWFDIQKKDVGMRLFCMMSNGLENSYIEKVSKEIFVDVKKAEVLRRTDDVLVISVSVN